VGSLRDVAGLDDQDRASVAEGVDDVIAQIIADRISVPARPCQQVLQPIRSGCTAVLGDRPAILAVQTRPSQPSTPRHAAVVRSDEIAARSDRSPRRTPTGTDQGLRYEPRRPRHIQMCSQTPNNAAVTAPTSADTSNISNPNLRLQY
jgi:hypothetical protein